MAKLIFNCNLRLFVLEENERDRGLHYYPDSLWNSRKCGFSQITPQEDRERLLKLFGVDWNDVKDRTDEITLADNVNPYVMKINCRCVVYFGEDLPKIRYKVVKTKTKHYQLWTRNTIYKENKPERYFYAEVKEEDKLFFFFSSHYDFVRGERLAEFNEREIRLLAKKDYDYIARLDYTDEQFKRLAAEKIKREKAEFEERKRRFEEIERLKRTDGYCDYCGAPASYVVNPYDKEMHGRIVMQWLCRDCYESCLGDI